MFRNRLGMCLISAIALSFFSPADHILRAQDNRSTPEIDQPETPPALKAYMGRKIAQTMHYMGAPWLVRDTRQRQEDCELMFENLKLKPGMTVCDMGCGNGFYTLKMAEAVGPEGKVLAVDIQSEMLRLMEARAAEIELKNIDSILGTVADPKLPVGKVDLILCVDVYHEFSHPEQMLRAMRRSLKPDGVIALLEFRLEDRDVPIKLLHKMSKKQIMKEFPANGFKLVRTFDKLPWQHMMFFGRDESWKRKSDESRKSATSSHSDK